ncbi:MAG: hypothetical protein EXQ93_04405 [Alphaproteobacteria bacterium]|nr:hypothetical protein [Alphaproteobacteria bacterium]
MAEEMLADNTGAVMQAIATHAVAGNAAAIRVVAKCLLPDRVPAPQFDLPRIETAADSLAAMERIPELVAAGVLNPNEGNKIHTLMARHRTSALPCVPSRRERQK